MPEHFTKGVISASFWCKPCGKPTMHRVDAGRRGPCLVCLEKREKEAETRPSITCPRCGLTSYHESDIKEGYCGHCHDWTGENAQSSLFARQTKT